MMRMTTQKRMRMIIPKRMGMMRRRKRMRTGMRKTAWKRLGMRTIAWKKLGVGVVKMMRMKVVGKRKRVMMKMSEFERPFHILFCKDHVFRLMFSHYNAKID